MIWSDLLARSALSEIVINLIGEIRPRVILRTVTEGVIRVFEVPLSAALLLNLEFNKIEHIWFAAKESGKSIKTLDFGNLQIGAHSRYAKEIRKINNPIFVRDLSMVTDLELRQFAEKLISLYKVYASLIIPITSAVRGTLGLVIIATKRSFSREEIGILEEFGRNIGRLLDLAEKVEETILREKETSLLIDLLRNVSDMRRNLKLVVKYVNELIEPDLTVIFLYNPDTKTLEGYTGYGVSENVVKSVKLRLQNCPFAQKAFHTRKPIVVSDIMQDTHVPDDVKNKLQPRSSLIAPMFSGDEPLGILAVVQKRLREFTPEEVKIVKRFADQSALAIEKARLHENLQRTKDYLKAIFDSQQDIILVVELDGSVLDANKSALDYFGLSRDEILTKHCYKLIKNRDESCLKSKNCPISRILELKKPTRIRTEKVEHPDLGSTIYDVVAAPIYEHGRIGRIVLSMRDVTREIELEEKLRAVNELGTELLLIRDPMRIANAVLDVAENVLKFKTFVLAFYNEMLGELMVYGLRGEPENYAVNKPVPEHDMCAHRVMKFGEPYYLPVGTRGFPEICVPIKVKDKVTGVVKVEGYIGMEFDDNDMQLLMALASQAGFAMENARLFIQLGESERRYRSLLENANDAIFVVDNDGFIVQANKVAAELTEYRRDELLGKSIDEIFEGPEPFFFSTHMMPTLRTGRGVRVEGELVSKSGARIPVEWSGSAVGLRGEVLYLGIARDLREQKRAERTFKALNSAALAVMRHLSEDEIFSTVGNELRKLDFESALFMLDETGNFLKLRYLSFGDPTRLLSGPLPISSIKPIEEAITYRRGVVSVVPLAPLFNRPGIIAPLTRGESTIGVLVVLSNEINERDLPAVTLFAHQVSIALENAKLYQSVKEYAENLRKILELSIAMNTAETEDQTIKALTDLTVRLMDVSAALVALYDANKQALVGTPPAAGVPDALVKGLTVSLNESNLIARSVNEGKVYYINDLTRYPSEQVRWVRNLGIRRLIAAPLKVGGNLVGAFCIGRTGEYKPFEEDDARIFAILANHAATAIRNAQLFDRLKRTLRKLEATYEITLAALVNALDAREHETQFHSQRVAEYARRLAKALGITGQDLRYIYWGGLLHDIGKIGIPDSILLKPGKLNDDEWKIMKQHPLIGFKIVEKIDFLGPARDVVLYHHERWDGRGYPFGLKGEEIPLGARIFALADTLDAITSDRPYRKALPFEYAIEEIAKNAGKQFDPHITKVFLSIPVEEWQAIKYSFAVEAATEVAEFPISLKVSSN